jgi:hypothetical protein
MSRRPSRPRRPLTLAGALALSCLAAGSCSSTNNGAPQDAGAGGAAGRQSTGGSSGGSGNAGGGNAGMTGQGGNAGTSGQGGGDAGRGGGGTASRDAGADTAGTRTDAGTDRPDTADAGPTDAALREAGRADRPGVTDGPGADTGLADAVPPPFMCNGPGPRFATRVVAEDFGPGQNFGQDQLPGIVLGPPKGGGSAQGSTDVCSLGVGGSITLAFDGNAIIDGPGPDFIVFENPFAVGGDLNDPYAELGIVAVSDDGVTWVSFPCTATAPPYGTCAGWNYVYANAATNDIDPTDPAVAGGDPFDLADIGVARARFVRVTSRPDLTTVFDLDAISIVNAACD